MTPVTGRWLAPLAASVAVLAVFVGPGVLATTVDGGRAPAPDRSFAPDDPVTPSLPPDGTDEPRRGGRGVEIVGYRTRGRVLDILYTVDQSQDCSARIDPPKVDERAAAVRVTLSRTPSRAPGEVCTQLLLTNQVRVRLGRPLGGRVVQDGARGGAPVSAQGAATSDTLATPPASRSGR